MLGLFALEMISEHYSDTSYPLIAEHDLMKFEGRHQQPHLFLRGWVHKFGIFQWNTQKNNLLDVNSFELHRPFCWISWTLSLPFVGWQTQLSLHWRRFVRQNPPFRLQLDLPCNEVNPCLAHSDEMVQKSSVSQLNKVKYSLKIITHWVCGHFSPITASVLRIASSCPSNHSKSKPPNVVVTINISKELIPIYVRVGQER